MSSLTQSTVVPIDDEPAPKLTVEAPLPGRLAQNVVYISCRVENEVVIELVDPEEAVFTKQTVSFDAPGKPDRG